MKLPVVAAVQRFAAGLRFPRLLLLTATLFIVNLFVPDAVPLADEIILGLLTLIMGRLKKKGRDRPQNA